MSATICRWLCGLVALLTFQATAAISEADFTAANKLYEQGKYAEAVSAYEKMIQSGAVSPVIYFNLGDASFKSAQIGHAIAAFRQAAKFMPRDADVRANLQFARNQVSGPTRLASRWERLLGHLSLNEWTWVTVAAFWFLFLLLAARQVWPKWRNTGLVLTVAAALLIFGAGMGVMMTMHREKLAVVVSHEAPIRNGPFEESANSFTANDGAELEIVDQKEDWYQVTDGRGRIGWLKRDMVAVVPKV